MPPTLRRHLHDLPRGVVLPDDAWTRRHRVLVVILALHLPTYLGIGLAQAVPWWQTAAALAGVVLPLALAASTRPGHLLRALAATIGLSLCSAMLVALSGGLIEAHLHYFVVVALVGLYQDWRPFLVAVGAVVVHHGVLGTLLPDSAFGQPQGATDPWLWALVHGGAVLGVALVVLVYWRIAERELAAKEQLWRELYEGEHGLLQRVRAAEAVKNELVAVVSHEFRTPLTAIMGYSQLLSSRLEDLDPATARSHLRTIDDQARRLARIVQNVLAVSGDVPVDANATTDLAVVAAQVAHETAAQYDLRTDIHVRLPSALRASIHDEAAHRLLGNLVDNAAKFAEEGTPVQLTGHALGEVAVIEISNHGALPGARGERIFEPFVQGDSSDSRTAEGVGLGLAVASKLAELHGGSLCVLEDQGRVVARLTLPRAKRRTIDLSEGVAASAR